MSSASLVVAVLVALWDLIQISIGYGTPPARRSCMVQFQTPRSVLAADFSEAHMTCRFLVGNEVPYIFSQRCVCVYVYISKYIYIYIYMYAFIHVYKV